MSGGTESESNQQYGDLPPESVLFGTSEVMQELRRTVARLSPTTVSVLLQGEVGVGKGVLSQYIHSRSTGLIGPYVTVNCSTLAEPSHEKDPFAALHGRVGVAFSQASEDHATSGAGTLFLDQVSELVPQFQQQLSYSLAEFEEHESQRQPDSHQKMRIISASRRDLRNEVKEGRFRRDLFHRLVVVTIEVPALRSRIADLPAISDYLRTRYTAQFRTLDTPFPADLFARMMIYPWPGNILELANFVRRYVLLGGNRHISPEKCSVMGFGPDHHWGNPGDPILGKTKTNWKN